jgi:hypothetical protein
VIQYFRHEDENAFSLASSTHKYAGGIANSKLKNRMTRHESRRLSPKTAGPSVPEENLRESRKNYGARLISGPVNVDLAKQVRARQDVRIGREPYEEYFNEMRVCPVFDGDRVDTYNVTRQEQARGRLSGSTRF